MIFDKKIKFFLTCLALGFSVYTHDVLFEFKGAGFFPGQTTFRDVYGNAGEVGFELTSRIINPVYIFTSVDFLSKSGETTTLQTPTKAKFTNIGIGLKYFAPFKNGDFYLGLGAQPTYLSTFDQSEYVPNQNSRWGCGGIAKAGFIVDLPSSFFLDLFVDYSFVTVNFTSTSDAPVISTNANLNGCLVGLGIGYRFN